MFQREVMVVDKWHKNGAQDLITASLCFQNAINKMHLCSLSITYACPYIALLLTLATQSTTLSSLNHSPTQRCLPSALNSADKDSSVKRTPPMCHMLNVSNCPLKSIIFIGTIRVYAEGDTDEPAGCGGTGL